MQFRWFKVQIENYCTADYNNDLMHTAVLNSTIINTAPFLSMAKNRVRILIEQTKEWILHNIGYDGSGIFLCILAIPISAYKFPFPFPFPFPFQWSIHSHSHGIPMGKMGIPIPDPEYVAPNRFKRFILGIPIFRSLFIDIETWPWTDDLEYQFCVKYCFSRGIV